MQPTQQTTMTADALSLLTEAFKNKAVISGLITSYVNRVQELENAIWGVINSRMLANASNAQLDLLGKVVGEPRAGRQDAPYRIGVRVRVLINRSQGLPEDIIQVAKLATSVQSVSGPFYRDQDRPSKWQLALYAMSDVTLTTIQQLTKYLGQTRPAGTYANLLYTPLSTTAFRWGDATHLVTGAGHGFCDANATPTTQFSSAAVL